MRFKKSIAVILIVVVISLCGCNSSSTSKASNGVKNKAAVASASENIKAAYSNIKASDREGSKLASSLKKVTLNSKALDKDMKINIYLPKGYSNTNKYPVLYLMHGYTGNEDSWMYELKLKGKVDELIDNGKINPLIIVTPQINNSFGINSSKTTMTFGSSPENSMDQGMYEDYIYKDVVSFIDSNYSTIASKEGRYIGGLSMGGYVALHLAFSHLDMFSKVGGHSPALYTNEIPSSLEIWLYPRKGLKEERDPICIAQNKNLGSLQVYLDCGDNDSYKFYEGCDKLYKILKDKGINAQYHLNKGEHNGAYWEENSEKYLLFYAGK
jgi:enterochelin esterase-like enzyme